jgi:two-component system OmpR family response regulator
MRILIIEDDDRVSKFIAKGLKAEGYQVTVAFDGTAGTEMTLRNEYDLMLLDLTLPGKDGVEICADLRARGWKKAILILTARDAMEDKVRGLEAGADDYVTKPFAFEELLARIKALQRRNQSFELGSTLQIADLVLDHNTHEVRRAGRLIELTPTEFSLLEYLMRHPRRVLSRVLLEESVWGYQQDPLTNVVDVYIRRLRKKIDQDFEPPLIYTIRGIGYQLKE